MPDDLTPAQQRAVERHRASLYRLMDVGALQDVVELLHQLDQRAAREQRPPRYLVQLHTRQVDPDAPTDSLALVDAPTWEQLLHGPQQGVQQQRSRPHGLTVLRGLDQLETWLEAGKP